MRASTAIVILCLAAEVALSVALPLPVESFKFRRSDPAGKAAPTRTGRKEITRPHLDKHVPEQFRPNYGRIKTPPLPPKGPVQYPFPKADLDFKPPSPPPIGKFRKTPPLPPHYELPAQYNRYPAAPNSKSPAQPQPHAIRPPGVPQRDPLNIIPPTSHTSSQPLPGSPPLQPGSQPPTNSLVGAWPPPPLTFLTHPHQLSPESSSNPPVSPPQALPFESPPQQHGPAGKPPDPVHPKFGLSGRGSGSAPDSPPP